MSVQDYIFKIGLTSIMAALSALTVVLISLLSDSSLRPVEACCTAASLGTRVVHEDRFRNYDFRSQTDHYTNVDWPLTILFFNQATINKVKAVLGGVGGSTMYGRVDDGGGWVWDADGGRKHGNYCTGWGAHIRLYAPNPPDYMYNVSWGYYVLASTHYDGQECGGAIYGWTEDAEDWYLNFFQVRGYSIGNDWDSWGNYQCCYWEGVHYWSNNGYASWVHIP